MSGYMPIVPMPEYRPVDRITVKVARLGECVQEVDCPRGTTVQRILDDARVRYSECDFMLDGRDILLSSRVEDDNCLLVVKPQATPRVPVSASLLARYQTS